MPFGVEGGRSWLWQCTLINLGSFEGNTIIFSWQNQLFYLIRWQNPLEGRVGRGQNQNSKPKAEDLVLFLQTVWSFSIFGCKEYKQSDFAIDHLVIFMCRVSLVLLEEGVCYDQSVLLAKLLLAFALPHFVLQGQTCLLLQVSLGFLLLHSSPLWWKGHLFLLFLLF